MSWRLSRTVQCAKCPWRVDVDPRDIPNGYSEERHCALRGTIAIPGEMNLGTLRVMQCHETTDAEPAHCLGWLMNQLGSGNNLGLRMLARNCENIGEVRLIGDQHESFEETLPE